jgi:hypothetical protein
MRILSMLALVLSSALVVPVAHAEDSAVRNSKMWQKFRCEKMTGAHGLADLKEKLVGNCDLLKPFSISQGDPLNPAMIYCCHLKGE